MNQCLSAALHSVQGLTLRLALWPMATKNFMWATNLQAALAHRDQWIFTFYSYNIILNKQ